MPPNSSSHFHFTVDEWSQPTFFHLLTEAFKDGDIKMVYDVGACSGGWTKVVLDNFGVDYIYCFEPDRDNFNYLKDNIQNDKVIAINFGIYYGLRESKVYGREGDPNIGARFVEGIDPHAKVVNDQIFRLMELEHLSIVPDLIKLDVEGAEKNIIMNSPIIKDCRYLIIEWHDSNMHGGLFFKEHLPNHNIVDQLGNGMFLLKKHEG